MQVKGRCGVARAVLESASNFVTRVRLIPGASKARGHRVVTHYLRSTTYCHRGFIISNTLLESRAHSRARAMIIK
jgi:hypothetical protein